MNVITSIEYSLWKIVARTVPALFPVASVEKKFDENGEPTCKEGTDKKAALFIKELSWCIAASEKIKVPAVN